MFPRCLGSRPVLCTRAVEWDQLCPARVSGGKLLVGLLPTNSAASVPPLFRGGTEFVPVLISGASGLVLFLVFRKLALDLLCVPQILLGIRNNFGPLNITHKTKTRKRKWGDAVHSSVYQH